MAHGRDLRHHPGMAIRVIVVFATCTLLSAQQPDGGSKDVPREKRFAPRLITAETRADPERLRALQKPGRVLFCDDFERDTWRPEWFEVQGRRNGDASRLDDERRAHRGHGAARFVARANDGKARGVDASGWLGAEGHDVLYFRRWIRFADDYDQGNLNHTGGGLAAVSGNGKWDGMGKAGIRPNGDDRFTARFEPWRDWGKQEAPGYLFIYAYWMDMKGDRDGNYWGNMLRPEPAARIVPERGKWVCLEQMVRANTVGDDGPRADGELAAWVDGKLYLHYTGIRWRSDARVRLKRFSIGVYVHRAIRDNEVLYDDVVVSTGYIGPDPVAEERTR